MIKLIDILNEVSSQRELEEIGIKDIGIGAAMTAASIFGGVKSQTVTPTNSKSNYNN